MGAELERAFSLMDTDPIVKCIVLTGAGKGFCAGMDLHDDVFGDDGLSGREQGHRDSGGQVSIAIHRCSKPTIAAIHGSAVGVGITMCLGASVRVAYQKAKIGFVFSRRGLVMEGTSS